MEGEMYKLRLAVLTCAATATVLLALVAAGVAGADPRANFCDVEDLWAASVFSAGLSNGAAFFDIFDQAPPAKEDNDGSETFQIALGLGNAGEGDKYHFRFETVLVSSGATARGHGFLFVTDSGLATFVIAGRGTHPLGGPGLTPGSFTVTGGGEVVCVADEGTTATADNVRVEYENGMTDDVFVNMAHCAVPDPESEGCSPPGD
jgi:hypothetical protein